MVDHNKTILAETSQALKENYPQVEILTAVDAQSAESLFEQYSPKLVVLDLDLPDNSSSPANFKVGIKLLKPLMQAKNTKERF